MGLFSGNTQTTNQTTTPWGPAQAPLKFGMGQARKLYNAKAGFKAPPWKTWAPFSSATTGALSGIMGQAQGANPLAGMSENALTGILSGDVAGKYGDLLSGADNPHWEQAVQNQSNRIADDVAARYSMSGRYGSDAMTGDLVRELGDYRTGALSSKWDQNIANQRGILGDIVGSRMGAVGAAPGAYAQRFAPYEMQAKVGSAYDDLNARRMQANLDRFNTNTQSGWNRLGAYNNALSGGAGAGQTSQSKVQDSGNPFGALLGGGLGILSLLSGL